MPLEWNPAFTTGIDRLDLQHQTLIQFINGLDSHSDDDDSPEPLIQVLDFLINYAASHFRDEEACMHAHRCPAAAENKICHEKLTALLLHHRKRLRQKGKIPGLRKELHAHLHHWVETHICKVDTQLQYCVTHPATALHAP